MFSPLPPASAAKEARALQSSQQPAAQPGEDSAEVPSEAELLLRESTELRHALTQWQQRCEEHRSVVLHQAELAQHLGLWDGSVCDVAVSVAAGGAQIAANIASSARGRLSPAIQAAFTLVVVRNHAVTRGRALRVMQEALQPLIAEPHNRRRRWV